MTNEEAINLFCFSDWIQCLKIPKADLERIVEAMSIVGKICINQSAYIDREQVKRERDAAVKDLNEFLSLDELCPIQCKWCKWENTNCDGKIPEWRGPQKED